MQRALKWLALILGTVLALGSSLAAYRLADYSWNQVVDYRGPYARAKLPSARAGAPMSDRVVLVIVDGLREDVSRKMPTLNRLREQGSDWAVVTSQPSLSFPNWTTLLSGAPQRISGVTTNWFTGRVPVETLIDTALEASRVVAVSAPTDFEALYGVKRTGHVFLRDWDPKTYMSAGIVDNAIRLARESSASLVVVHLPDIDEAGHAYGGAARQYLDTAGKVDGDLVRLVTALESSRTAFAVVADHGHIDTGGHGGWEDVVTRVPAVFAGAGVKASGGVGTQDQVAPTVALLSGLPVPRNATGAPLDVATGPGVDTSRFGEQLAAAYAAYTEEVSGVPGDAELVLSTPSGLRARFNSDTEERLASERVSRLPVAAAIALAALAVVVAVGLFSWRALVSALTGAVGYYLVYDGLYFVAHGYRWSLSSFNSEDLLKPFMNGRLLEAAIAGVVAAAVAADIYLATRREPRRPAGEYLPGWLALGTATVLVIQATLWLQVAWYLWQWGAAVTWLIPDLKWGFKYDLDLIQLSALAGAALLAPVVTYLVGRYHPLRRPAAPIQSESSPADAA